MTIISQSDAESSKTADEPKASRHVVDHAEVRKLIGAQYSGLLTLLRRKLKDRELAADLINDAIVITLEHAQHGRLVQLEGIGGYVFKVSMNLLRNHARSSGNRSDLRSDGAVIDTIADYDTDGIEATQIQQRTQKLIESLSSSRDREVIRRFYLDEEDKEVICDKLGLTPLQFTQVMSRARQRMKQLFELQGFRRNDFLSLVL